MLNSAAATAVAQRNINIFSIYVAVTKLSKYIASASTGPRVLLPLSHPLHISVVVYQQTYGHSSWQPPPYPSQRTL